MDKLKMSPNQADENFRKLATFFPNSVTETIDDAIVSDIHSFLKGTELSVEL